MIEIPNNPASLAAGVNLDVDSLAELRHYEANIRGLAWILDFKMRTANEWTGGHGLLASWGVESGTYISLADACDAPRWHWPECVPTKGLPAYQGRLPQGEQFRVPVALNATGKGPDTFRQRIVSEIKSRECPWFLGDDVSLKLYPPAVWGAHLDAIQKPLGKAGVKMIVNVELIGHDPHADIGDLLTLLPHVDGFALEWDCLTKFTEADLVYLAARVCRTGRALIWLTDNKPAGGAYLCKIARAARRPGYRLFVDAPHWLSAAECYRVEAANG